MNKIKGIAFALPILLLAACGGEGENAAEAAEKTIEYEIYAKDVNTPAEAIEIYVSRMNRIADALEQIENKADADYAAKLIANAAEEYELLDARMKELGRSNLAGALAESGYAEMYMRRYAEAQTRLMTAMQEAAQDDPGIMLKLGKALQKMQGKQAL